MYFSVIVPIYGVEKYIRECVDSILCQNFDDFELILVDDGSPDGCPKICDEYGAADKRVRVIHKQNGGLVSARQEGIKAAKGRYVINVDGDDFIEPGYFKKAAELCEKHDPDIITFGINYFDGETKSFDPEPLSAGLYKESGLGEIHEKMLLTPDMKHMHYFLWAKVFKKQAVFDCQQAVDRRISMGEDVTCLIPAYLKAKRIYISDEAVYNCRCRNDSMSRSYKQSHFDDIRLGVLRLLEAGKEAGETTGADENFNGAVDRYAAFMFFVIFACGAQQGDKNVCKYAKSVFDGCFCDAFERAEFSEITVKSKWAVLLPLDINITAAIATRIIRTIIPIPPAIFSFKTPTVLSLIAPNIKRAIGDTIHKKAAYAIVLAVRSFTERKAFASSIDTRLSDGVSSDESMCSASSISSFSK